MNISSVKTTTTTPIECEWSGEVFTIDVLDNAITPSVMQAFRDVEEKPIEMARGLSELIVNWTLTIGEDDEPYPPTIANLATLPVDFLTHLMTTLTEVYQGKKETPSASVNGSGASASSKTAKAR